MKRFFVLIAFLFAGWVTAYSQVKLQFVEANIGQSIMSQGSGYSLFDKAVGDNLAFCESLHLGWGQDFSRSKGTYIEVNTISMPEHDEFAVAFSLGFEMRRYIEINPSLRVHSDLSIGGICVANGYTLVNEKKSEWRLGLSLMHSTGIEMTFGKHLYVGGLLSLAAKPILISSFKPTDTSPDKGKDILWGSKIMLSAGYRL